MYMFIMTTCMIKPINMIKKHERNLFGLVVGQPRSGHLHVQYNGIHNYY